MKRVTTVCGSIALWLTSFSSGLAAEAVLSLPDLIKQVEPAVVRIDVKGHRGEGIGSGFVIGSSGIIATNHHVMAGATQAEITFSNGKTANVTGTLVLDAERDISILQIDNGTYPTLPLAQDQPIKGTSVVAFGAPHGLSFTATEGIVSAVRTSDEIKQYIPNGTGTWVQTSTPISPGNSGGPLVNRNGEVVGANTWHIVRGQNLNFAISAIDISDALQIANGNTLVSLADGAAKVETEISLGDMTGTELQNAVNALALLIVTDRVDSMDVDTATKLLLLVDTKDIRDKGTRAKVAKAFKRVAFESAFHSEDGVRGMAKWGGKHSIPYLAELLEIETFQGSEAVYDVLSQSKDPKAAEAIALRLGNFFDGKRALAALRRMGARAEPGLIRAVPSSDAKVSITAINLLGEYGTEASFSILDRADKKGVPNVKRAAKDAKKQIRYRIRQAEKSSQ